MARRLDRTPPTSAVARLLDSSAVSAAFAAAPPSLLPSRPPGRLVKREIVFTRETDERFQALVDACRQATGARVTASHVARSLIRAVSSAMQPILHALSQIGPQRLPSNAPAYDEERTRFEAVLARAIGRGLAGKAPAHAGMEQECSTAKSHADGDDA